jgi:hypothetical protein
MSASTYTPNDDVIYIPDLFIQLLQLLSIHKKEEQQKA